ncbi:unnamed protein product [Spirodela intermedia]|uniref:U-box domain-containing protein n=1 Tax=Spirodela intermedia TaxID=51605 RepID=A0A7I8IR89_SPIIN|nr:unnamed protein product [Spirodela intermedia]CAA6660381.1 unnamed protein product [Spirodela intermedia]
MSIPHLFRCPISLDLFTDPVTLSTGQTYDRLSIERLTDPSLVPNHTLRHLIDQWLLDGPNRSPHQEPTRRVDHVGFSLAALKQNLQSPSGGAAAKVETLRKIRILAMESDVGQSCLIQLGFLSFLLRLLFQNQAAPWVDNLELAELALDCILSFLCYLLDAISYSPQSEELCLVIGQNRQVLQGLVCLLNDRTAATVPAAEAAVRAISGLCSLEPNQDCAIRSGVVDGLVGYLSHSTRRNAAKALSTLELLVGLESGSKALLRNNGAVRVLVKMIFLVSDDHQGGEHAVGVLLTVCQASAQARVDAVNARVLTQLLLLLQSQCSPKAKNKARALLKLLSSMWIEDPRVCNSLI